MKNPWDRSPLPSTADKAVDAVYSGIGHVISEWEGIEVQLCRIYSFFVLKPDDRMVMHDYGDQRIFINRIAALKSKAEVFFCSYHDQAVEAEFDQLTNTIEGYSGRRNDVAHGIVLPAQIYKFFIEAAGPLEPRTNYYALFPPHYKWRGQALDAVPPYAYNSEGLHDLAKKLSETYGVLTKFRERIRVLMG